MTMASEPCPGCGSYEDGAEEHMDDVKLVCYEDGQGGDSRCFSRRCHSGRFLKLPEAVSWNEAGDMRAVGHCSRCGDVALSFVCWKEEP